jgi:hypothetical protein
MNIPLESVGEEKKHTQKPKSAEFKKKANTRQNHVFIEKWFLT